MKTLAVELLLLLHICSVVQGIATSCKDVSAYLGDPANITCVFSENINQTRTGDFRMYRYDLFSSGTEKEALVLDCYWSDGAKCQTTEGYTFDKNVSNQLTVVIPHAKETYQGRYECQVQPTDPTNVKQCRLTLKAGVKPTPSPDPIASATLTTEAANKDEEGGTNAAAIVVPIILVLIILVCAGLAYRSREKIFKRFPTLRFWETPEDPAFAAEGHSTVEYVTRHDDASVALLIQPVLQLEKDPLQHDQQSISQSEKESLVRVSSGDNPVVNEESDAEEGDEQFWLAPSDPKNDSDKHSANKVAAPGDKTFIPTSGIKSTAQQPAVHTVKYEHENSSIASSRDSEDSYHRTSPMKTGIPYTQEMPEILQMPPNNATKEITPSDTEDKEINLPGRFKHPIQASDDAEIKERKSTEVNIEETHTAAAPGEAVYDSTNTEKPAALAKDKIKKKVDKYATAPEMKSAYDEWKNAQKDTSSKPGGRDEEGDHSDDYGDSYDNVVDDDDGGGGGGDNGADDNMKTIELTALLKEQSKGKDEKNATATADKMQQFDELVKFPDVENKEANESNAEDKEDLISRDGNNDDNNVEVEASAVADNNKDIDDDTDTDHTPPDDNSSLNERHRKSGETLKLITGSK